MAGTKASSGISLGQNWISYIQFHIRINYIVSLMENKTNGNKEEIQESRTENQANGLQFSNPSSLNFPPGPQVTSQEMAASLLSFCSSEIGTWISSGWLELNPDKSRAMLIGSGKEFEEVTRNATSSTIKKVFPQSGLGGDCTATGAQKNADKCRSLSQQQDREPATNNSRPCHILQ